MSPASECVAGLFLEWEQCLKLLRSCGTAIGWKRLTPQGVVCRDVTCRKRKDGQVDNKPERGRMQKTLKRATNIERCETQPNIRSRATEDYKKYKSTLVIVWSSSSIKVNRDICW